MTFVVTSCSTNRHFERTIRSNSTLDHCKLASQLMIQNEFNFVGTDKYNYPRYRELQLFNIDKDNVNEALSKFNKNDKIKLTELVLNTEIINVQILSKSCQLFTIRRQGFYPYYYSLTYLLYHNKKDSVHKNCFFINEYKHILKYRKDIDSNWIYFKNRPDPIQC